MQNKRIAHFIETGVPGGAEALMLKICKYLKTTGNHPVVLHNGHEYFIEQCKLFDIEEYVPDGFEYFKSIKTLPNFTFTFKKFLQEQKIDLLHSHLYGPITGAAAAAKIAGVPHIGTLHDVYMIEEKPSRIRLLQMASFIGTKLITVSKTMEQFYRNRALFKEQHISTIYNGVNCQPTKKSLSKASLNIAKENCLIVNVGRLVVLKRHDLLLNAISQIELKQPWQLLIVGDGPEKAAIENQIQSLDLENKVILTGQREDVSELLAISDLFVQCSDTEGLSMSIMEAMAAGLPSIVTDVGGNKELIQHAKNGFVVKPGDVADLTEALQKLINQQTLRNIMREFTLVQVNENFNIDMTLQKYMSFYKKVIG